MTVPAGYRQCTANEYANARCCDTCKNYSFKIFYQTRDDTEGKCFLDYHHNPDPDDPQWRDVHWVENKGICPAFDQDQTLLKIFLEHK